MFQKISKCRICGNDKLTTVLDLGEQMLAGIFPENKSSKITKGPLRLVKCVGDNTEVCGLLQLEHTYDLEEMYGLNYGYRSGLNPSMVKHLHNKVKRILNQVKLNDDDLVIDIGSNDSTTLQAYPSKGIHLVGIDPTGVKFSKYYPPHIKLIPEFFPAKRLEELYPDKKAKVITSFSMFYDLENPLTFMKNVYNTLDEDGIWVFEQSYMPTMLEMNSYDTVCQEHLEYYALNQIKWMADRVGFSIIDVEFNDINGGSFSVTARKQTQGVRHSSEVERILDNEMQQGLATLQPYSAFENRVLKSRDELINFIKKIKKDNKTIYGLGASTKGNILLQFCGLSEEDLPFIGEVNPDKFNCYTPGTNIPIIPEDDLLEMKPDYLLVLPWHFKNYFLNSEKYKNIKLVFPLPNLTIIQT